MHGKLFAESDAMKQYIARYEQNPRLKGDYIRDKDAKDFDQQDHDGVTVIWYHSMQAFQDMVNDPYYIEHIIPDEDYLLDRDSQAWILVGKPNTIVSKSSKACKLQTQQQTKSLIIYFCNKSAILKSYKTSQD